MIRVEGLCKTFTSGWLRRRRVEAVKDVSFSIAKGETLGLVGESGCGKSTLSRLMVKLLPADQGRIYMEDQDITNYTMTQMLPLRRQMQIIFQHPDSALNPRQTMQQSLIEPLLLHRLMDKDEALHKAVELLELVGLGSDMLIRYPHQISGGQIQRVVIARALTLNPRFLVLDEPTSMLDVSVQAQVMEVLQQVQSQFEMAYLFISHDLELVAHVCQHMAIMHRGGIIEQACSKEIMEQPQHPYTKQLVQAFGDMR
jgi:peptide/nickel transport system ATP-binding protein